MTVTRVYLPLDPRALATLSDRRELGPPPLHGHAVTPAQGSPGLATELEDLEYAAWSAAAESARDVAGAATRRVVASADVDSQEVQEEGGEDPTRVVVDAAVPLRTLVSFHIDEEPGGDLAAVLWFDVTELDEVVRLVQG